MSNPSTRPTIWGPIAWTAWGVFVIGVCVALIIRDASQWWAAAFGGFYLSAIIMDWFIWQFRCSAFDYRTLCDDLLDDASERSGSAAE